MTASFFWAKYTSPDIHPYSAKQNTRFSGMLVIDSTPQMEFWLIRCRFAGWTSVLTEYDYKFSYGLQNINQNLEFSEPICHQKLSFFHLTFSFQMHLYTKIVNRNVANLLNQMFLSTIQLWISTIEFSFLPNQELFQYFPRISNNLSSNSVLNASQIGRVIRPHKFIEVTCMNFFHKI